MLILRKFTSDPAPVCQDNGTRDSTRPWGLKAVGVLLVPILCHGFTIMTGLTKSLPVTAIPEEFLVTAVRNDMVNDCSCHDLSLLLASDTQRMGIEEDPSGLLPPPVVSLFFCCFCIMVMELDVFLTVEPTIRNCPPATRMLARCIRSAWHYYFLLNSFLT